MLWIKQVVLGGKGRHGNHGKPPKVWGPSFRELQAVDALAKKGCNSDGRLDWKARCRGKTEREQAAACQRIEAVRQG